MDATKFKVGDKVQVLPGTGYAFDTDEVHESYPKGEVTGVTVFTEEDIQKQYDELGSTATAQEFLESRAPGEDWPYVLVEVKGATLFPVNFFPGELKLIEE